jgi:hypothetical protein
MRMRAFFGRLLGRLMLGGWVASALTGSAK